jgi:hypothetical protein
MSNLTILGDTSGSVVLQAPAVSGSTTLTLPATTGTVMVNGPAFSAYNGSSQSFSTGFQQILFPTEEFDTNNNFASSRFTPNVAGYYQLSCAVRTNGAPGGEYSIFLRKNTNNSYKMGTSANQSGGILSSTISITAYANGSTDYFEIWFYVGGACSSAGGETYTWFTGSMVRGA